MNKVYYWITSGSIIFWNTLLQMIIMPMVSLIGLHLITDVTRLAALTLGICLLIDMAVLPILIGANFSEESDHKISYSIFHGHYTDFSAGWYPHIGRQIQSTMIIFTFQPLINFAVAVFKRFITRFYFRNFVYNKNFGDNEKINLHIQNDYLRFLDLYAGPEYEFHQKVATTNVVIIISMLFGGSMPVLYLLGALTLANQYFIERLSLAYFFRLPPKFTEMMPLTTIRFMSYSQVVGTAILLW